MLAACLIFVSITIQDRRVRKMRAPSQEQSSERYCEFTKEM